MAKIRPDTAEFGQCPRLHNKFEFPINIEQELAPKLNVFQELNREDELRIYIRKGLRGHWELLQPFTLISFAAFYIRER